MCVYLQQLTKQKATADHAASILDKRFSTPDPRREPVVLLVDEVSHFPIRPPASRVLVKEFLQNISPRLYACDDARHTCDVTTAVSTHAVAGPAVDAQADGDVQHLRLADAPAGQAHRAGHRQHHGPARAHHDEPRPEQARAYYFPLIVI